MLDLSDHLSAGLLLFASFWFKLQWNGTKLFPPCCVSSQSLTDDQHEAVVGSIYHLLVLDFEVWVLLSTMEAGVLNHKFTWIKKTNDLKKMLIKMEYAYNIR